MVFRTIPPVPVTALGNQQFFKSQLFLCGRDLTGIFIEKIAGRRQMVPGEIVFRGANPNIEICVNP